MAFREYLPAALAVAALLACGPDADDAARNTSDSTAVASTPALPLPALTPAQVESLAAQYPSLRPRPATEPRPTGWQGARVIPASVSALPAGVLERITGEATFYADRFEGKRTASGIPFRQNQLVAAHRAYPFGTLLRVTNAQSGRSVNVRVVDRGPWGSVAAARNTVIDLSRRAATELGFVARGRAPVKVEVLEWGPGLPSAS